MLLYYITDRKQFAGPDSLQRRSLLDRIGQAAAAGVDYIQLREKDLGSGALESLAREAVQVVRESSKVTRLLINSRLDIALAAGADGIHLTSTDMTASDARAIWAASVRSSSKAGAHNFLVAVSCHSPAEIRSAESHAADFGVLAPIFEKPGTELPALGLELLAGACLKNAEPDLRAEAGDHRVGMPVFALGGLSLENVADCVRAGVAGIAGIRLFQEGDLVKTVASVRALTPSTRLMNR
jgi:thiamine-phosphate pyrophosphorylase